MKAPGPAVKHPHTGTCAVCGRAVQRGRLMCAAHWRQVPQPMQVQVWRTWSQFQNRKSPAHALQQLAEYRRAADAATNFVMSFQQPLSQSQDAQQEIQ